MYLGFYRKMKEEKGKLNYKIMATIILFCISILSGCYQIKQIDYTNYFAIREITPIEDETENMIEISYEISNLEKKKDLDFSITIDDKTETYTINPDDNREDKVVIDIGKPDNYNLTYAVTYEVFDNGKSVWTQEDSITYDCSSMFIHPATIKYGDKTKSIELIDYQSNYFDLSELFPEFDVKNVHNVVLENNLWDFGKIQEDTNSEKGKDSAAVGNVLSLFTNGEKINDKHHFTDGLVVVIEDATSASSVDWRDYLEFTDNLEVRNSSVLGVAVTTLTFCVNVENPSDEYIYGSIMKFYVNDSALADEYMFSASEHRGIEVNSIGELRYTTSGLVMKTTGVTDIRRIGMEVMLEGEDGNILYDDILWLELE